MQTECHQCNPHTRPSATDDLRAPCAEMLQYVVKKHKLVGFRNVEACLAIGTSLSVAIDISQGGDSCQQLIGWTDNDTTVALYQDFQQFKQTQWGSCGLSRFRNERCCNCCSGSAMSLLSPSRNPSASHAWCKSVVIAALFWKGSLMMASNDLAILLMQQFLNKVSRLQVGPST